MKTKIFVTKKDIKNGCQKSCFDCPVALAINRKFKKKEVVGIFVDPLWIKIKFKEEDRITGIPKTLFIATPKKVEKFIMKFDSNRKVKPFSFCLNTEI